MKIKGDKFERVVNGRKDIFYPDHFKEQIVRDLEAGATTIEQAQQQLGIHYKNTIKRWLKKFSTLPREQYMRPFISQEQRRQAAMQIDSGKLTVEQASLHYQVGKETIKQWIKLFSLGAQTITPSQMKAKTSSASPEQKDLLRIIEEQRLRIAGLETMIDIAEENLRIPIRKKFGSKQCK